MIRFFALVFVAGLLAASTLPQSALAPSQAPTAAPSEKLGHVFFTVKDKSGNLVSAPSKDKIQVRVDGHQAEIEEVRSLKTSPLFFDVLVDVSGSSHAYEQPEDELAIEIFRALSTGHNEGHLILFGSKASANDQADDVLSVEMRLRGLTRQGMTALFDGVVDAASRLASASIPDDSPRAIFILSDGDDNYGHKDLGDALKALDHEGIPLFAFIFRRPSGNPIFRITEPLQFLADQTGGSAVVHEGKLLNAQDAAAQMADLASSRYMVSFKLPALKPGRSYDLKVDSLEKGVHFTAQNQYFLQ